MAEIEHEVFLAIHYTGSLFPQTTFNVAEALK